MRLNLSPKIQEAIEQASGNEEQRQEEVRKSLRMASEDDLLVLHDHVLLPASNSKFLTLMGDPYCEDFARYLQSPSSRKYISVARNHLKTTMITAWVLQQLLRDPMASFMWVHAIKGLAETKTAGLRQYFENNEILRWIAPELIYKNPQHEAEKWTEGAWTIKRPEMQPDIPSVLAAGLDSPPTSVHTSKAIFDDLVVDRNCATVDQISKAQDAFRSIQNILHPDAERLLCGTTYRKGDIMMTERENKAYSPHFIRPCLVNGAPLMPRLFSMSALEKQRDTVGPIEWAAQWLLEPQPDAAAIFDRSLFQYGRPPSISYQFLYIDPALGGEDKQAVVAVLWGQDHKWYVRSAVGYHLNQTELIDKILKTAEAPHSGIAAGGHTTLGITIETNFPAITSEMLTQEQTRRYGKIRFLCKDIKHTSSHGTKLARVSSLHIQYTNKQIIHCDPLQCSGLESEMLELPYGHPDLADALAMILETPDALGWWPPAGKSDEEEIRSRADNLRKWAKQQSRENG
jgi:hypothetical protein